MKTVLYANIQSDNEHTNLRVNVLVPLALASYVFLPPPKKKKKKKRKEKYTLVPYKNDEKQSSSNRKENRPFFCFRHAKKKPTRAEFKARRGVRDPRGDGGGAERVAP